MLFESAWNLSEIPFHPQFNPCRHSLEISPLWKRGARGDFINAVEPLFLKSPFIPLCQRGRLIFSCSFVSQKLISIPVHREITWFEKSSIQRLHFLQGFSADPHRTPSEHRYDMRSAGQARPSEQSPDSGSLLPLPDTRLKLCTHLHPRHP